MTDSLEIDFHDTVIFLRASFDSNLSNWFFFVGDFILKIKVEPLPNVTVPLLFFLIYLIEITSIFQKSNEVTMVTPLLPLRVRARVCEQHRYHRYIVTKYEYYNNNKSLFGNGKVTVGNGNFNQSWQLLPLWLFRGSSCSCS